MHDTLTLPGEVNGYIKTSHSISVFHVNVRSARNKKDELHSLFHEIAFEFDVIMLTETWYNNESEVLRMRNYESFFLNRDERCGGGIIVYKKKRYRL